MNKTKIVATIGPASNTREKLEALAKAGVSIFRLNFSHGCAADFVDIVASIRSVEAVIGRPLTIMQDLSGPKIRLGNLDQDKIEVGQGTIVALGPSDGARGEEPYLPFDHPAIFETLVPGDRLVVADGGLQFTVRSRTREGRVLLEAGNAGIVTSRKGLALPGKATRVRALTPKDKKDLKEGLALGVDAVAISYVQTPDDVRETKELMDFYGRRVPVCVKLERQGAVDMLESIVAEADIVMVARGDLGVECPLPKLPSIQKRIIAHCNEVTKPVIVATQMLLSMVSSPVPTRAETTDVANAVLDGADCVMLSEETAMGAFPVEAVAAMRKIANEAEALLEERHSIYRPDMGKGVPEYLAYSACILAKKANAKAIVVHSLSGASTKHVSSLRPQQRIFGLTTNPSTLKLLNYCWGVNPIMISNPEELRSHLSRAENFILETPEIKEGECAVITAGQVRGNQNRSMGTNLVKIFYK